MPEEEAKGMEEDKAEDAAKEEHDGEETAEVKDEEMAKEEQDDEKPDEAKDEDMKEEEEEKAKDEKMEEDNEEQEESKEPAFTEEEDASADSRSRIEAKQMVLDTAGATTNVVPVAGGKLLMTLSDGGLQYMLAGTKAAVGMKAGRYMFEAKIVEFLDPYEGSRAPRGTGMPRQLMRVGFATQEGSVLMEDSAEGQVFFDNMGQISMPGSKSRVHSRLHHRDTLVAAILNLDGDSPNANTFSVFVDGKRVCPPKKLPESMLGKTLFPCITYKNVTVQVNFGPSAKSQLPFKCRMFQDASMADVEVVSSPEASDAKAEVLFPLGLPDQGIFDWADMYLAEHPKLAELSERKLVNWAEKSGIRSSRQSRWESQDKPGVRYGISAMDDGSVKKIINTVAPTMKRDYLVLELDSNLRRTERKKALAKFPASDFKRVAVVAIGEPPANYKAKVQELLLAEKVAAAEKSGRGEDTKKKDDEKDDEKDEEKDAEAAEETEKKAVELTEEEKAQRYRKLDPADLSQSTLVTHFAEYSLPDAEEGFDEIRYVWGQADDCQKILREWVLENKKTKRIEDLEPSDWFKERQEKWQKQVREWKDKQEDAKEAIKKGERQKKEEEENKDDEDKDDKPSADEEVDVFEVEDVMERPLFVHFKYEDWVLLSLRYELHLLVHAFKRDVADEDRPSFSDANLEFYYNRYFRKHLQLSTFGVSSNDELVAMIKDSITINSDSRFLEAVLPEDEPLDKFLRHTEKQRRDRQLCIDAGDETAELKFTRAPPPPSHDGHSRGGKGGKGKGGKGYRDGGYHRPPPPPSQGGRSYNRDGGRPNHQRGPPPSGGSKGYGHSRGGSGGGDRGQGQKRSYPPPPPSAYASSSKHQRH